MIRRKIDRVSLTAFRFFEAAATRMNFTAAARDLGVTQAAVSRRISALEDHLGAALFRRTGRRLGLTEQGELLLAHTTTALDYLEEGIDHLSQTATLPVSLVTLGSVSHLWLPQRLQKFTEVHPHIPLRLLTTDNRADHMDDRHDLTIVYLRGGHPRWQFSRLFAEQLVPVASPEFLRHHGLQPPLSPATIAKLPLLNYSRFDLHWVTLGDWLTKHLGRGACLPCGVEFSNYAMTIEAAVRSEGVALGSRNLLTDALETGALVEISDLVLETGYFYLLGRPRNREISHGAQLLYNWLVKD